jgi:SAM-dependent methyltransferase
MRFDCACVAALACAVLLSGAGAHAADEGWAPMVGQEGKDVVWVPTPPALVEKMLDMANVTPRDFVMDLGSGDGRNIIAAAKRGARALGVEYNPSMVEYATREAEKAGVADKAKFVQGDMYESDISDASVLALFLLPENLRKLTPKFLALKPGTRIVANHFGIDGWNPDETARTEGDCSAWCTALLYIVPANVAGTWRMREGDLTLEQTFQVVSGALAAAGSSQAVRNARLHGDEIRFSIGDVDYIGYVKGDLMQGNVSGSASGYWSASRTR